MTSVAIIGAEGYVGTSLCRAFAAGTRYTVTPVTRSSYDHSRSRPYDIIVNAAMPSGRFWAQNNPEKDFEATVKKTADLLYGWSYGKFVQISSVSARCQPNTVYGRHKAAAESLCPNGESLILRLGPMYSETLRKGVLIDMLNSRDVFVAGESRYCFAPLDFVSSWIAKNVERTGLIELGAQNAISLQEVAKHLGVPVKFQGPVDHQEISAPGSDYPNAREVLFFLDSMRRRIAETKVP